MAYGEKINKTILKTLRTVLLERTDLRNLPEDIWKRSAALNTWGTNAIEGSTIGWAEVEAILLKGRSVDGKPIRDVLETIQHERVFRSLSLMPKKVLTPMDILELHEEVFKGVHVQAGQWRRSNVRITGAKFTPPRMEKVVPELKEWLAKYYQMTLEGGDVFRTAARMHFEFERIHPFPDGNGRIGRLILNLHFLQHNWPPVHILPQDRDDYLDALNRAARDDLQPLEDLLKKLMASSLLDLLDQVGTDGDELMDLKAVSKQSKHSPAYLGLRCKQGSLPGVLTKHRWLTSRRSLELYGKLVGRE